MEDITQEIKSKLDIVNIIQEYVPLKKSGKNYKALCPFHKEKTPSFMVSPELQIFKCFGCNRGGDIFSFIQESEGVDFPRALEILAQKAGVKLRRRKLSPNEIKSKRILEVNHLASEFFHFLLTKHRIGDRARRYLRNRGIKDDTIKLFKLGYAPNSWDSLNKFLLKKGYDVALIASAGLIVPREGSAGYYDRFRGRLMFPLRNELGEVVSFSGRSLDGSEPKYINGPESLVFKKERFLFNLDLAKAYIRRGQEALLVEGEFDAISPFQIGFKNIVASKGTSLTEGQLNLIKKYAPTVTIFFDTDTAGFDAVKRAIDLANNLGMDIKIGILPDTVKDPDEAVRKDAKIFEKASREATTAYDFYFNYAQKKYDILDPIGKKRASDFLIPIINSIKHDIQKAYYIKKLSEFLDVPEDAILAAENKYPKESKRITHVKKKAASKPEKTELSMEEYIVALLLKSPLDLSKKTLHKLSPKDFTDATVREIVTKLKNHLRGRKYKFTIKPFYSKLTEEEKKLAEVLYLWDIPSRLEDETNLDFLEDEIDKVFDIIKRATLKRNLRQLSKKIKNAEIAGNAEELRLLQKEFSELSKKLKW